jgi:hypothetical protein
MSSVYESEMTSELKLFGRMDRNTKFWVLVVGIMFFFGCHNYMQELIMSLPGFKVYITPSAFV